MKRRIVTRKVICQISCMFLAGRVEFGAFSQPIPEAPPSMPRGYTTRKLEAFSIHAHLRSPRDSSRRIPVDYQNLFERIIRAHSGVRVVQIDDKVIAIHQLSNSDGLVKFTAYEGEEGSPLFYNFRNGTERIEQLERGEMVATKTHGLIDIARREAIVEFNQKGAKSTDIATALAMLGERGGAKDAPYRVTMTFTPIADGEFVQSIERFKRIRFAAIKVARPNIDWGDHVDYFNKIAEESDAHTFELSMSADRKQSLSERRGIMRYIKDAASAVFPYLKGAKVTGTREGEEQETTVSLAHHVEHQRPQVRLTEDGQVDDADIERKLEAFRNSRARRDGGDL